MDIDAKQMLTYVISILNSYGITYLQVEDLRKSKMNQPGSQKTLQRLLFDLCVLHVMDFEVKLEELELTGDEKSMRELVMAHLAELDCPYLVEVEENWVGVNFGEPRELLVVVGWVMAVADVFGRFYEKVVVGMAKEIDHIRPEVTGLPRENKTIHFHSQPECLSAVHKRLVSRVNSINNLKNKQLKLTERINSQLKQAGIKESIPQLLSTDKTYQRLKADKTKRLAELIDKEAKLMRYRKVFWAWMESVIKKDRNEIYEDPNYGFEQEPGDFLGKIIIDPKKLEEFFDNYEEVHETMSSNQQLFDQYLNFWDQRKSQLTQKQRKQLNTQSKKIDTQLKQTIPNFTEGVKLKANSFIGIQLQQALFQDADPQSGIPQEIQGDSGSRAILERLCHQNIENLEDLKFL